VLARPLLADTCSRAWFWPMPAGFGVETCSCRPETSRHQSAVWAVSAVVQDEDLDQIMRPTRAASATSNQTVGLVLRQVPSLHRRLRVELQ